MAVSNLISGDVTLWLVPDRGMETKDEIDGEVGWKLGGKCRLPKMWPSAIDETRWGPMNSTTIWWTIAQTVHFVSVENLRFVSLHSYLVERASSNSSCGPCGLVFTYAWKPQNCCRAIVCPSKSFLNELLLKRSPSLMPTVSSATLSPRKSPSVVPSSHLFRRSSPRQPHRHFRHTQHPHHTRHLLAKA